MKYVTTLVLAAIALGACGGDGGTSPSEIPNISGSWNFSENISEPVTATSCNSAGTAQITQSGSQFSGTINATSGVCSFADGRITDNTGTNTISGGQITGTSVSFQIPFCQLDGTISGSPPNRLSGSETCSLDVAGTTLTFTGTWQASR